MARIAVLIFIVLAALLLLRLVRHFLAGYSSRSGAGKPPGAIEGEEMVRDPICGTWIDRRLALAARSSGEWIPVCSEKCRTLAEGT